MTISIKKICISMRKPNLYNSFNFWWKWRYNITYLFLTKYRYIICLLRLVFTVGAITIYVLIHYYQTCLSLAFQKYSFVIFSLFWNVNALTYHILSHSNLIFSLNKKRSHSKKHRLLSKKTRANKNEFTLQNIPFNAKTRIVVKCPCFPVSIFVDLCIECV